MEALSRRHLETTDPVERVVAFLREIGLQIERGDGTGGFVRGVRIEAGAMIYDAAVTASNLLHEAGHIAICPGRFRHLLKGNLDASHAAILALAPLKDEDPDGPLYRALIQMSDPEATAWAYAAGIATRLQPERIIEDHDYEGEGADIRFCLRSGHYMGINGLQHAGMTQRRGENRYPSMTRWLQVD